MVMWFVVRVCISLSVVKTAAAKALDERACLEHPAPGARLLWAVCCRVPAHAMDERDLRGGAIDLTDWRGDVSRGPLSVVDLSHQFRIAQFKLKNKPARSAGL